jgi:hypothetical protein
MPRINVNLVDVESGFQVYPDGQYIIEITDKSKIKKTENGANILWIGEIVEPEEFAGKLYSWNTSLLPQALWNLKAMLEAIEVPFDEEGFEMEEAFGKQIGIVNAVRDYNGQDRNSAALYFAV